MGTERGHLSGRPAYWTSPSSHTSNVRSHLCVEHTKSYSAHCENHALSMDCVAAGRQTTAPGLPEKQHAGKGVFGAGRYVCAPSPESVLTRRPRKASRYGNATKPIYVRVQLYIHWALH